MESGGAIYLGGNFTVANVGTVNRTNGTVYMQRHAHQHGHDTDAQRGERFVGASAAGQYYGGTVVTANGASLMVTSGTLDGVTVNGVLDVGNSYNAAT